MAVKLIESNVDNLNQMLSVLRRQKGASNKAAAPCLVTLKKYSQRNGGVDLCDK